MKLKYSGSDKYGSYRLKYVNQVLFSEVEGAIGLGLAKKFQLDLMTIFSTVTDRCWGYVADLSKCQAYTEEVENLLPETHRQAAESGCVIDAYVLGTALVTAQLSKIRIESGIELDLKDCSFDTIEQCQEFVISVIEKQESLTNKS